MYVYLQVIFPQSMMTPLRKRSSLQEMIPRQKAHRQRKKRLPHQGEC